MRILGLIVLGLGAVVAGLVFFRTGPVVPPPDAAETPAAAAPRPTPAAAPRRAEDSPVMSPADASSPAEITAREAAEAQARFEKEAGESHMMVPDMDPAEMMPPDVAPPMKN